MISDVTFYSAPISHRNRVFPLGAPGVQYKKTTVKDALCVEDLAMRVHVDWFTDWDKCNLVYLHTSQEYYWVNQMGTVTNNNKQVMFDLVLNPVTSYIKKGDTLKGVWDRVPNNVDVALKDPVVGGAMAIVSSTKLPKAQAGICWVEMVLKKKIGESGERITRYGMFCNNPSVDGKLSTTQIHAFTEFNDYYDYPSMSMLVNNFGDIFDTPESTDIILSINASARCPYKNASNNGRCLTSQNGTPLKPKKFKQWTTIGSNSMFWCAYEIESTGSISPLEQTVTISLSEEEMKSADVSILNGSGSVVSTIPTEYFGSSRQLTIKSRASSDYLGIYTDLDINGHFVRLNGSRLPWLGDAWLDYQARTMAYDRNSMELAISNAKEQKNIDIVTGVSNAVMTSVVGGAISGGGVPGIAGGLALGLTQVFTSGVAADMQMRLSERTARSEQELTEQNQKAQLSNYYSVGESVKALIDDCITGYTVTVAMPTGYSNDFYTTQRDEYGYKAQGVRTITVDEGYHKGRLLEFPINGLKGDLLNNEFIEGLKLVDIGEIE